MPHVLMTGATGFVGQAMTKALLARGDSVTAVTRDVDKARRALPAPVAFASWDADGLTKAVSSADAVLHLAGEQVVGRRWTPELKKKIMDSRVVTANDLVLAIERAPSRPRVFVSASGVGYYGPRGNEPVDEKTGAGTDFLAEVSQAWEAAVAQAATRVGRIVYARFGIILGRDGGAIPEMARPFKMFVGGPIGSGEQPVPWIHLDDVVNVLLLCLDDDSLEGPVNVTTPHAVTNAELAREMGRVLHRPAAFRVPAMALRLLFGEGAEPILTGQRAVPAVLMQKGFEWRYPRLAEALEDVLA
jgi:hypothetical protein